MSQRPYTKWYNVHERVGVADFYTELMILPFVVLLVFAHIWGTRVNKRKAKAWGAAHIPLLQQEYASVGMSGRASADLKMLEDASTLDMPQDTIKENAANEFISYATGRQNVAFLDTSLRLAKRYNPMARLGEEALGLFFESMPAPKERFESTAYTFDGREGDILGAVGAEAVKGGQKSTYDSFVWAVVHKDMMQALRNSRYDLSLTFTKDNAKLPNWATVMSESAEITDTLLTPELISALNKAGESLESLIITDQPVEKPATLDELSAKKRVSLSLRVPSSSSPGAWGATLPLYTYFLRLPDTLVSVAHFRAEVLRRVKSTREEESNKIKKVDLDGKAEDRRLSAEKAKRQARDAKLKTMSDVEQKKFLEKERTKEFRKSQMKGARKG
jgi:hypothetical protein